MDEQFLRDVMEGLRLEQKAIQPKWLYDERGSALFEDITQTDDYYVTRTEASIMAQVYAELPGLCPPRPAVAEFGSGAGIKSQRLIEALDPAVYVSIDVAEDFLAASSDKLRKLFPQTDIHGVVGDFTGQVGLPDAFFDHDGRMGFFPGSTIGNFERGGAGEFLAKSRKSLGDGSLFLIGVDLVKDEDALLAAYDDDQGATRAFMLNLFRRMRRELDAELDPDGFEFVALWNPDAERIEMGVVAIGEQAIKIGDQAFSFEPGEFLHLENSHKYRPDGFATIAKEAGWRLDQMWTDERQWFGVFLLKAD